MMMRRKIVINIIKRIKVLINFDSCTCFVIYEYMVEFFCFLFFDSILRFYQGFFQNNHSFFSNDNDDSEFDDSISIKSVISSSLFDDD